MINIDFSDDVKLETLRKNFVTTAYKSQKLEEGLEEGVISRAEFEKKQVKIIRKFFKKTFGDASQLENCKDFKDYIKAFCDVVGYLQKKAAEYEHTT